MLAATSAGVIDGIFIGNFVGAPALAAVNIAMPAFYFFAAVIFMLAVGGSVMCGKFLGEQDPEAASLIFSKTLYAAFVVSGFIAAVSLFFLEELVSLLGANQDLHQMVRDYIQIILWAAPLLIIGLTLDYFVRVDGRPVLASVALVTFAASNIALDWLFIVHWGWGIKGAAWATALAEGVILIVLSPSSGSFILIDAASAQNVARVRNVYRSKQASDRHAAAIVLLSAADSDRAGQPSSVGRRARRSDTQALRVFRLCCYASPEADT